MGHLVKKILDIQINNRLISKEESSLFFQRLLDQIEWKQETITMWGKKRTLRRRVAWYGDLSLIHI